MERGWEARELTQVVDSLERSGWEVVREYAVESGTRTLRADAVLLFEGVILAVVEVKATRSRGDDQATSRQLNRLAELLGAPLALLWRNGAVFQLRDIPGVVRGRLQSFPPPGEILQLLGPLRQLFSKRLATCQAVTRAVQDWRSGGATRTGNTYLPAIEFYANEHQTVCAQVPLTQCVLIGGMLEGMLRETAVAKDPAGKHKKKSLADLITWCTTNGYISAGTGAITPDAVRNSRNALHPNLFVTSPTISHAIASNAAQALAAAVRELNASV
ncbi:hypothetical protein DAERI_010042 [Deinococcus aerius]|uniref:Uncharacterized protein n=1 Tax=Deinococcus aerius TaxID=200253 RepID=A0A2I9D1H6_9DEIO|nr:hypothetical protein DAERI_010042 [Deinococcus aerius]